MKRTAATGRKPAGLGLIVALSLAGTAAAEMPVAEVSAAKPQVPAIRIVASIFPIGDVAVQIGGDAAQVEVLLPPGLTPHEFDPKPPQVEQVAVADLILTVGLGGDLWAQEIAAASANPGLRLLSLARMVPEELLIAQDPHAWLDPVLMAHFAGALAESLATRRPADAAEIRLRAQQYQARLADLDRDYRQGLLPLEGRTIVSVHTAFGYVAARYGLREVGLFHAHMEEGGPHAFEELVGEIREHDVRTLFVQPQLPPASARWLQEETGVQIEILDPLGNTQAAGYDSYIELMIRNLEALVRGLRD